MELEEIFEYDFDKKLAEEIIKKLKKISSRKGIKKPDLEIYLRDTLTAQIFNNVGGVINKLMEQGYVARKKFTKKDFKEDLKQAGLYCNLALEIPRYHLTKKGKRLYKEIC